MKKNLLALRLFLIFISFTFSFYVKAQTPYIKTSSGIGQYGYLEKDATTTMLLNSNTHANIYQLFSRTWLNGNNILTYGTAVNSCGGSNIDQTTNNYNFGASAVAGQIAYTSVHADYCGGGNSYGGNPNQTGFNERQHYIFDISDNPSDLSASVNPVNGNNTVVMSVKIDFGTVSDRILQRFWIQNTGTMSESTDIANDGFKIYYEPATGSEVFNGTESSATLYGDYNSNSTSNNVYGHDALNIAIPSGGLRIYVVLNKYNNTCVGGKTVQVSLINDGLSFTPNMDTSFNLARIDQVPSSPTAITASSTLTGALNGTYNIPSACFPTVASTVTYLNTNGVSGPVIFNVAAGHTETAPAGGFSLTATGTAANTITFQKSGAGANPTFTAPTPQTSGNLNDAIFKIIGGDYITIDGFTMQENAANTTTAGATNNMTEFGVALFYASTTNGCQNITLKNNTITLNRNYQNTFGIYSNSTHSATSMTVSATATGATGGNHNLTITGNTISNINQGISIIGPTAIADTNDNIVIGGSLANANSISNFGTTGTFSGYANVSGTVNGVLVRNTKNLNISYNNITSSNFGVTSGTLTGIQIPASTNTPTATFTHNINNNSISLSTGNSTSAVYGIYVPSGSASTTSILNINNNSFSGFNCSVIATASLVLIYNASTHLTESISGNTFNNITANTTGAISFINNSYTAPANGSKTIQNNSVVTGFTRSAAGTATFYGYYDFGSSPSTVTHTLSDNNFSNINTGTSTGAFYGIYSADYSASNPTMNVYNNSVNNCTTAGAFVGIYLTGFSGTLATPNSVYGNSVSTNVSSNVSTSQYGIYIGSTSLYVNTYNNTVINNAFSGAASQFAGVYGAGTTNLNKFYNNTITNNTSSNTGSIVGIFIGGGTQMDVYQNTINTLSSLGSVWGIYVNAGTTINVYNHKNSGTNYSIYGLSSTGASATVEGIRVAAGTTINAYDNEVYNISGSGATGPIINGLDVSGGTTTNAYRNKIYNIGRTGAATTGSVNGIYINGASTNIYNNTIGNITDTNSNMDNAARGIGIISTTASTTHNIFHNTINLNASSAGTNFGSSGIFHTFNTTATTSALNLRNNIIINKSTANGTGKTVAFRRSAATNLNNFATTSNNNIFYAGTPSATNPIYYDGTTTQNTLADYKTAMSTRDQNSYTEDVSFISTTGSNADFLRIASGTITAAESSAPIIATPNINNDYWLITRPFVSPVNGGDTSGTLCDIGASEFDGSPAKPSISFVSMTPSGNQCTNVARAIVVNINPRGTLTGAPILSYQVNGGAATNIAMTAGTGTLTSTGTWTATIPTITPTNGTVTWSVSATNGISTTYTGTSYVDEPLNGITATATANPTQVCPGGTVNLSSTFGNSSAAASYTTPTAVTNPTTDEDLGNVTITQGATTILNNTSARNSLVGTIGTATGIAGSYSNFTSFGPYNLTRGQAYNFSLSSLQNTTAYSNSMAIYIDYNRDGDFNDAGENVYVAAATTSGAHTETGSFTVPATASYGQTRMRVICNEGLITGPTMTVAYGEFEEYMLNIVPSFTSYQWSTASDFSNTIGTTQNLTGYTVVAVPSTYYVKATEASGCSVSTSVTVNSPAGMSGHTITPGSSSICYGSSTTLTQSITGGCPTLTYAWIVLSGPASHDGAFSNATTLNPTFSATVPGTYVLQCTITDASSATSVQTTSVTVNNPQATSTNATTVCGAGTSTLTASPSNVSNVLTWYTAATGGSVIGTGTSVTSPTISAATTYYVEEAQVGSGSIVTGSGTTNNSTSGITPLSQLYKSSHTQYLIRASDLSAAGLMPGNITSLSFNVSTKNSTYAYTNYSISIGNTALTALTGVVSTTGFTNVYSNASYTSTVGTNLFTFSTPYNWDGSSNIIVDVCFGVNASYSSNDAVTGSTKSYNCTYGIYQDSATTCGATTATYNSGTSTYMPNFTLVGQVSSCKGTRVSVAVPYTTPPTHTVVTSDSTVCNNAVATLSVDASTVANYSTYTWYVGTVGTYTNLYQDAACTLAYTGQNLSTVYAKTSTAGNVTYTCAASGAGCNTTSNINVRTIPVATFSASPSSFCLTGGSTTISLSPISDYTGATITWESSPDGVTYTPIVGQTTPTYNTTVSATTYYRVTIGVGASQCQQLTTVVNVNNPTILTTTPATRCGTGTVTLGATANGSSVINWYAAATGGTTLGTGTSFTTPSISTNTTYYVEASTPGGNTSVGPASPIAEGGTIGAQTIQWDVNFTVLNSTTLNSVTIYPIASGQNGVITVRSGTGSTGTVLSTINYTTSVSGGATPQVIPVNVNLSAGNYSLYTDTLPTSGINRNTTGASYPYTSSVANITGNGFSASYYMGLYDWNFSSQCSSARTSVMATVTTPPSFALSTSDATICSGSSTPPVTINTGASDYDTYTWSPNTDVSGNNVSGWTFNPTTSTTYTLTASQSSGSLCSTSTTFTVTVNAVPTDVNITTPDSIVCPNTVQTLTATGGIQTITVLSENFNAASSWTTNNANNGGGTPANASWTLRPNAYNYLDSTSYGNTFYSNDNSQFYLSNSDSQAGTGNNTTSLISPSFSTVGLSSATLTFYARFIPYTASDHAYIDVSTNGGTTWTNAVANYTSALGSETYDTVSGNFIQNFSLVTLNLDSYVGNSNVKVRFRYVHNFGYWWAIDNVNISGSAQRITWAASPSSPNTIFTDLSCTTPYNGTDYLTTVYVKPTVSPTTYTAASTLGSCPKSDNVTFSNQNTVWNGSSWSSAPASNKSIEFQGNYSSAGSGAGNIQACSCTVTSGNVTIASGDTMTLLDDIKVNGGSMTFNNDANLLQTNNVTNTGNIKVNRSTQPNLTRLDYVYWGSPVLGQGLKAFSPNTVSSRFYTYNEQTNLFVSVPSISTATFTPGVGYAIRVPNDYTAATNQQFNGVFTGVPNNGNYTYAATKLADGYNLVSNPYPSNLELDGVNGFYNVNSGLLNKKFYFWTNYNPNPTTQQGNSYLGDNYAIWTGAGSYAPGNPAVTGNLVSMTPTSAVKVGQGFIVEAHTAGSLVFNNAMRTSASSTFISKNVTPIDRYWISMVTPANNYYNQLIAYVDGATNELDANYDAEKLETPSDDFYSILDTNKLTIQGRAYPLLMSDVVTLGNKYAENGTYKITLSKKEGIFADGQSIYLHDKISGTYTDLQQGDYSFAANQGEQTDRFEITYKPGGTLGADNTTKHGVRVYKSGENVIIDADRAFSEVRLYDTSGRLIRVIKSGKNYLLIEKNKLFSEIIIFSIIFADETINKKIIFN